MLRAGVIVVVGLALAAPAQARVQAPGAPGRTADWAKADKHGFGTSASRGSHVWFTLREASMTEVYYPDLGHPSARGLDFKVDGRTAAGTATVSQLELAYTQTVTAKRWRLTRVYVTDPKRNTVLVRVHFEALDGKAHALTVAFDPQLFNTGDDDIGWTRGHALLAHDARIASALASRPAFGRTASGYAGHERHLLDRSSDALRQGNVIQAARTPLTGLAHHQDATLALGFGPRGTVALEAARGSLDTGFDAVSRAYATGWQAYRAKLRPIPASALPVAAEYETSLLVLKAHEDKANPGAFVASPTMPWGWGTLTIDEGNPRSAPYHLVWARDLYQIATALLAAGDTASANAALDFLFDHQQLQDGSFPQNSQVDGTPKWTGIQLDEVALPIVLAWQLGRVDRWDGVQKAADYLVKHGPVTDQDRWENQGGYSPGTIAAEIAGLVCAAGIARSSHEDAKAAAYEAKADEWAGKVQAWTATSTGPFGPRPYYLRLTKDGKPDAGTTYKLGDSGPAKIDQRRVVDPSFLELVRLGIKRADDPAIVNSVGVIDAQLKAGSFWHRYSHDGYGEQRDGGDWGLFPDGSNMTLGRAWPIFAGERGEYELLAGRPANPELAAMAGAANDGGMIPEQVWDGRSPKARPLGKGTFSATPLAWSHAQFVRLAWSIEAGHPIEQPAIVAARYANRGG